MPLGGTSELCCVPAEISLAQFCGDPRWTSTCAGFETFESGLRQGVAECADERSLPVKVAECPGLRAIQRDLGGLGGTIYYYHPDRSDLVGVTVFTDAPLRCPEGSARPRELPTFAGMTPDSRILCPEPCHGCGLDVERLPACRGPEFDALDLDGGAP